MATPPAHANPETTSATSAAPATTIPGICGQCGEDWPGTVHAQTGLCLTCRDTTHPRIPSCPLCGRVNVSAEFHHVASERQCKTLGLRLCLVCHKALTDRQVSVWDPSWRIEPHPVRCIVQGVYDLCALWWLRSGARFWHQQLSELARILWLALVALASHFKLKGWETA